MKCYTWFRFKIEKNEKEKNIYELPYKQNGVAVFAFLGTMLTLDCLSSARGMNGYLPPLNMTYSWSTVFEHERY